MLFSSRDRAQAELVREKLHATGIRCEVRNFLLEAEGGGPSFYSELWVESNSNYHTASILYTSPLRILRQRAEDRGGRR